jgi:virginiamycin B lyase
MHCILPTVAFALTLMSGSASAQESKYYELPKGDYPHDVAAGVSGGAWYAGQKGGVAGRLDPAPGQIKRITPGKDSAPQGVIVGPDGAPWFTDGRTRLCVSMQRPTT